MKFYNRPGDRKAEAEAAGIGAACGVQAIKGLESLFLFGVWDAGTVIVDMDYRLPAAIAAQIDCAGTALLCRVLDQVCNSPRDQLCPATHWQMCHAYITHVTTHIAEVVAGRLEK